jgi:hypothetical protein
VHLRHPQTTENDLVEGRVRATGEEAVKLGGVRSRQNRISGSFAACIPCGGEACRHSQTSGPCGDRCCVLCKCLFFPIAQDALKAPAHLFRRSFFLEVVHVRLVLVIGDIDSHGGGIVRLLVGSVSLVAGRLGEVSEGVGNSVEEGANSAKRGGIGRAISSFADECLRSNEASLEF